MWRDTSRTPTLYMFDASIVILVPCLLMIIFFGFPAIPTVLFLLALAYYVVIALVLKMSLITSLQYLKWNILPKKRPSRRPVYVRRAYDIQGIGTAWRVAEFNNRSSN